MAVGSGRDELGLSKLRLGRPAAGLSGNKLWSGRKKVKSAGKVPELGMEAAMLSVEATTHELGGGVRQGEVEIGQGRDQRDLVGRR